MGLTSLPKVGMGEVLGPVKANDPARPFTKPYNQIDAAEWNSAMAALAAVSEALGLGDGSTPGSAIEGMIAILGNVNTLGTEMGVVDAYLPLLSMPSAGRARQLAWAEHFFSSAAGFAGGLASQLSGGTVSSINPSTNGRAGVVSLSRGTTANFRAGIATDGKAILMGGGEWRFRSDIRIPTLSNGTDRFTTYSGFGDITSTDPVDGVFFRLVDNVNGGRWQFVARSSSVETAVDTGITPSAGVWRRLEIVVAANGSSATGYIDGASVGTVSTNLPTGGRDTGVIAANLIGSLGTTAVTVEIDLCEWSFLPTAVL